MIDGPSHRKVARDATAASVVLLANKGHLLPLAKTAKIAAIGPWIKPSLQVRVLLCTWHPVHFDRLGI